MSLLVTGIIVSAGTCAQGELAELAARGEAIYTRPDACTLCHGASLEGGVGPVLDYGPTPYDISYQLNTNPEMGPINQELDPSNEDLLGLAVYIRKLAGNPVSGDDLEAYRLTLNSIRDYGSVTFPMTERDQKVAEIENWQTVIDDWQRRAATGNIKHDYEMRVVAEFESGEPKFQPEPGMTYYYQNLGAAPPGSPATPLAEIDRSGATTNQIVVGNAWTGDVIASYSLPDVLKSSMHTTATTPDGKFVYIIGARPYSNDPGGDAMTLSSPATLLKADALTLQPVKQLSMGGRMHHIQIFQDRYMQVDTFARDADGLDVFLMDPETDTIVGGIRDEELGGISYTSFNDDEHIYVLMQPSGYGTNSIPGYISASMYNRGRFTTLRPFWVAKVDPESWEVVAEYPYPGFRGNWVVVDSGKEHIYVTAGGSSVISKINMETGNVVWTSPTGTGPYGASLNADETEIWVADKGETTGMFGRTVTVIDTGMGRQKKTLFSGYQVDHVLLAPNGTEFWASSNAEGRLYVFNAGDGEQKNVIDMPGRGDPHGLAWVHYDENGVPRTVRDQGGFRGGINPAKGVVLDY